VILLYIFIYTPFLELTYSSDQSMDFHAWWLKRRGRAQGCAFWGFVYMAPSPFRRSKTINFGAWI